MKAAARVWSFRALGAWDEALAPGLREEWAGRCGADVHENVFFTPPLVEAWLDAYRAIRRLEPLFVIGEAPGGGWALLPLVLVHGGWKEGLARVLLPAGFNEYDYHDPVLNPGEGAGAAEFWRDFTAWLDLRACGADAWVVPRLRRLAEGVVPGAREAGVAPWIDLAEAHSLEDVTAGRPKSVRSDLARQRRRLGEIGALEVARFGPGETQAALEELPRFLAAHRRAWPGAWRAPGLLEGIVRRALPAGFLHFSRLLVGGRTASWHFGYRQEARFSWYLTAYDQELAPYSPGKVHLGILVEEAVAGGCRTFDLLVGDEPYKRDWTDRRQGLVSLEGRSGGLTAQGRMAARSLLRRAAAAKRSAAAGGRA